MEPFINLLIPIFKEAGEADPENIAKFFALTLDAFMGLVVMTPDAIDKETILKIIDERLINYSGDRR